MRISDWSSDVCSSDLVARVGLAMLDIAVERDACPHVPSHPVIGDPSRRIKLARRAHPLRDTARARRPIYAAAGGIIRIFRTRTKAETEAWSRSEERSVGKACVRTCRSGWSPNH